MKIFRVIAGDIIRNPSEWTYKEHYLSKSILGYGEVKITMFCNMPYVAFVSKISVRAGFFDRIRLWWASRKWMYYQFEGVVNALGFLPIEKWMEKREAEVEQRKSA